MYIYFVIVKIKVPNIHGRFYTPRLLFKLSRCPFPPSPSRISTILLLSWPLPKVYSQFLN